MSIPNKRSPIDGIETAEAEIKEMLSRLSEGDDDPTDAELESIGDAAWNLVALLRACSSSRGKPYRDPARDRPIMLGRRGLGRL